MFRLRVSVSELQEVFISLECAAISLTFGCEGAWVFLDVLSFLRHRLVLERYCCHVSPTHSANPVGVES